jgi:UDP-N-acetyl-D-galactosamine dehydrogenase
MMDKNKEKKIAVIGLGYVGLPLAVEFGKNYRTLGFDINETRISQLKQGIDETLEVSKNEILDSKFLGYTHTLSDLKTCNIYIVTVPTPIDNFKSPDLTALKEVSKNLGPFLNKNDIVIYESTVYPGATEEVCVPLLEKYSGLKFNEDFYCGYSPERINPGDKTRRLNSILKVTSGSTPLIAEEIDSLYNSIIDAGTYLAPSIKVAEAAKVIENTQRDVNIALINELTQIFSKLNIDTEEVLKAAETKWNFLSFRPGIVGGHCIGVDPYYLAHKASEVGCHPEMILAGRRQNENMSNYIAGEIIKLMSKKGINTSSAKVLILGLTFKENCPDIRNTKVIDLAMELREYDCLVDIFDPLVDSNKIDDSINLISQPHEDEYAAIVLAVGHKIFKDMGPRAIRKFGAANHVLYDLKYCFTSNEVDGRL